MKKILSILLVLAMLAASVFAIVGCSSPKLKMGLGVYTVYGDKKDADGDTKGSVSVATTAAAVLVDGDGKIVKCVIDAVEASVGFSEAGVIDNVTEIKTKGELGDDYKMALYGQSQDANGDGVVKEWYEQVDILCDLFVGKTLNEVKAMIVNGYRGTEEVMSAGCTIGIGDFIKAVEKAFDNLSEVESSDKDTLKLGFVTKQEKVKNATDETSGSFEIVSSITAATTNSKGAVTAIAVDSAVADFAVNNNGAVVTDTAKALKTKRELGDNYKMAQFGQDLNSDGVVREWYLQADEFEKACLGKTESEISALVVNGYGIESLQNAGCTIAISDMVVATVKATGK